MSKLIVFAGPNGSGKSSLRDSIPIPVDVVIDPDRLARELNPAIPGSMQGDAARKALTLFHDALASGKSLSIETTLTGHTALRRIRLAKQAGYEIGLVYVGLQDPELNVLRVAERVARGGHAIDPDLVRKRVGASLDNLPAALTVADRAVVLDNSGAAHRRVLGVVARRVTSTAADMPEWLTERLPGIDTELRKAIAGEAKITSPRSEPARSGPISTIFDALRKPASAAAPPWASPPDSIGDRVRALEQTEARKRAQPEKAAPEPPEEGPRTSRSPKP